MEMKTNENLEAIVLLKQLIDTAETDRQKKATICLAADMLDRWVPGQFDFRVAAVNDPDMALAALLGVLGDFLFDRRKP